MSPNSFGFHSRKSARHRGITVLKKKKYCGKQIQLLLFGAAFLLDDLLQQQEDRYFVRHDIDLSAMPDEKFKLNFRIDNYADFCRLLRDLRLGDTVTCANGTCVNSEFALAVVLRRLSYPNRWVDTMDLLGRERTQLSRIYNTTIDLIYSKHGYLLESLNQTWLSRQKIEEYAEAVHHASNSRYDKCWGFIDGTAREISRPNHRIQGEFYSGHCRRHVVKYQSIVIPNGLIANLWGPVEGRRHDCYMLGESNLRARLNAKNEQDWHGEYCLYGDKGYPLSDVIQVPFKGFNLTPEEVAFNRDMTNVRMSVEYGFLKIQKTFSFPNYSQNQKLMWQQSCKAYLVSAIFTNCLTCLYGFHLVKNIFGLDPPSLEDYLRFNAV